MVYTLAVEKTLKNCASVSLFFVVLMGGAHISATFLLMQGANNPTLVLLFNTLDLPFLLSALLYGSSKISLAMEEATGKGKTVFIICTVLSTIILGSAAFLNFAFLDANLFG